MENKTFGKALYLEFTTPDSTLQMLLTPDMVAPNGSLVPLTMYRRRVTAAKPRTTWAAYSTYQRPDIKDNVIIPLEKSAALMKAQSSLSFADKLFGQILTHGYALRVKPITVEIDIHDLDDICGHKTPYRILNRVTKSRKALKFPDSLI